MVCACVTYVAHLLGDVGEFVDEVALRLEELVAPVLRRVEDVLLPAPVEGGGHGLGRDGRRWGGQVGALVQGSAVSTPIIGESRAVSVSVAGWWCSGVVNGEGHQGSSGPRTCFWIWLTQFCMSSSDAALSMYTVSMLPGLGELTSKYHSCLRAHTHTHHAS